MVNFGQEQVFNPHSRQQWVAARVIATVWILATSIVAGLTRTPSRRWHHFCGASDYVVITRLR